jgi:putative spermidine/putrescine transport system ATP-binding protein
MTGLHLADVSKNYGTFAALQKLSLEVDHGQFVCLLGPSGCGKTTLLRIIAGLEEPTTGTVSLAGKDITKVPAHKRDFGMVFQSLALFPHLSVAENVAYPLAIRGVSAAERQKRAEDALELVHLPGRGTRAISQLSGGQRQRVAIARALVMEPALFLLDEPMSALDAKLRETMQIEVKRLQRQLGVTSLLVTHDQREAMTTADLVVVMSEGEVQQVAPPLEIYRQPANAFVADFIGTTNLMRGDAADGIFTGPRGKIEVNGLPAAGPVTLSLRPEDLTLSASPKEASLQGKVSFVRALGATTEVTLEAEGETPDLTVSLPGRAPCPVEVGQTAYVSCAPDAAVVLR